MKARRKTLPARKTPYPHQESAIAYGVDKRHAAFFLEMRLGKTLTVLRWAEKLDLEVLLVVAPLTVLGSWERECASEGWRYVYLNGGREARENALTAIDGVGRVVCLITFESLRETPILAGCERKDRAGKVGFKKAPGLDLPWDAVVLDESTKIKGPKASISKLCATGFRGVPHRAILSGLPAPESPLDYFQQFAFLRGGMMGSKNYYRFREAWFESDSQGWDYWPKPGFGDALKDWLGDNAFVMRRRDVDLGGKTIYERRTIQPTQEQLVAYAEARDAFFYRDAAGQEVETKIAVEAFTWLHRISGGFTPDGEFKWDGKLRELQSLIDGELRGQKILVWCRFNDEIQELSLKLKDPEGYGVMSMTGATRPDERQKMIKGFNRKSGPNVLVIQEAIGQFGLDLSASSTAIYYSNFPGFEQRAQSADRIVHPDKTEPGLVIDLTTAGLMDDEVVQLLNMKKGTSKWLLAELARRTMKRISA